MRSLRCALLCVCVLAAVALGARADQKGLDECLGGLDDMEIDLMILGRDNDSCSARQGEIAEAEAILQDMRDLKEKACRADQIGGGSYDPEEVVELQISLDKDMVWLRSEIEAMRAESAKVCGGGAAPGGKAATGDKAPTAPGNAPRQGGNQSRPASFNLTVCNHDSSAVDLAVSHHSAPDSPDFWVEGWWSVGPGECAQIGRFMTGWFYYFAEADFGEWSGDLPLCVSDEPFKRMNFAHGNVTCDEENLVNFVEIRVESPEFTVNLRP